LINLGSVHRLMSARPPNMSPLVGNILLPQLRVGVGLTQGLTFEELDAVQDAIDSSLALLSGAEPGRPDGALVLDELVGSTHWLELSIRDAEARLRDDGRLRDISEAERTSLAAQCTDLIDEHKRLWLLRNRPGGLVDSTAWLEHLKDCYFSGETDRGWFGPAG
jgi:hexosaminidase